MKLMLRYTWRYKRYLVFSLLGALSFILIQLGMPTLLKHVLNDALPNNNKELLIKIVIMMSVVAAVGIIGEILMSYANSRIATNVIRDVRNDTFAKTQQFSHQEFEEFSVSSLIIATTNDAYQIMIFVQQMLRSAMITPIMAIIGFWLIVKNNASLFWIVLAITPIVIGFVILIGKVSQPYSKKQQSYLDKINLKLRESLTGLRVIRAFRNEDYQSERFSEVNDTYAGVSKKLFRITSLATPGFFTVFSLMIMVVIWISTGDIEKGTMEVGTMAVIIEYIFHILFSLMLLSMLFVMYPRAAVSAERIDRILHTEPSIQENLENGVVDGKERGTIVFDNVSFAYDGDPEAAVLEGISFSAKPGETVAFIGSTGSGKSTLIQLIPRMFDVVKGEVLVGGVNVKDYNLYALRDKIGFIPQKAQLFSGTIAENLRLGKPSATIEELERAAEIAQASDFISQKEDGFDEKLSEGGSNLSGGQKQRLAIARAIVKRPEIYIFDDSFSALDYATDLKLRGKLKSEIKDATFLIVAQRVGTIMNADKILVLNEGKVVGMGTHKELLQTCPIYYDIASSQLSEEELS